MVNDFNRHLNLLFTILSNLHNCFQSFSTNLEFRFL